MGTANDEWRRSAEFRIAGGILRTAILAVLLFSWAVLQLSPWVNRAMGRIGRLVISRILRIFLAAIGVHFLVSGIREAFGIGYTTAKRRVHTVPSS